MLQFITHQTDTISYLHSAELVLKGGCKWVQLRMKEASTEEIKKTAFKVRKLCKLYNATFIIDDHVVIAREVGADGVHLGKNDLPVAEARKNVGNSFINGGTANTFEDIEHLVSAGADYIGLGPFRFTETKKNLSPVLGIEGYRNIMEKCRRKNITIPIVAIGGITAHDISAIMETGVKGIALSGSILRSPNPVEETANILNIIKYNQI